MRTLGLATALFVQLATGTSIAAAAQGPQGAPRDSDPISALLLRSESRDDSVRAAAFSEIRRRGPALLPGLDSILRAASWDHKTAAANALVLIGTPALPTIRAAARDTSSVGFTMEEALDWPHVSDSARTVLLVALVADSSSVVRARAVRALGAHASEGSRLGNIVLRALSDPAPSVREAAASQAIHLRDSSARSRAVPALVVLLEDSSAKVRREAVYALGNMSDVSAVAVPQILVRMQSDPDTAIRQLSIRALGWIGTGASEAVHPLLGCAENWPPLLQTECLTALGGVGTSKLSRAGADSVIGALRGHLDSPDSTARLAAVYSLVRLGRPAIPSLSIALRSPDSGVALEAARGLGSFFDDTMVVSPLLRALGDPRVSVRSAAAEAVAGVATDVQPRLHRLESFGSPQTGAAARRALEIRAVAHALPVAQKCYRLEYSPWEIPDSAKSEEWGPSPEWLRFSTELARWPRTRDPLPFTVQQRFGKEWVSTGYWIPDPAHLDMKVDANPSLSGKRLTLHVEPNGELRGHIETYWDFTGATQRAPVVGHRIDCERGKDLDATPAPKNGAKNGANEGRRR